MLQSFGIPPQFNVGALAVRQFGLPRKDSEILRFSGVLFFLAHLALSQSGSPTVGGCALDDKQSPLSIRFERTVERIKDGDKKPSKHFLLSLRNNTNCDVQLSVYEAHFETFTIKNGVSTREPDQDLSDKSEAPLIFQLHRYDGSFPRYAIGQKGCMRYVNFLPAHTSTLFSVPAKYFPTVGRSLWSLAIDGRRRWGRRRMRSSSM
jgi:hypothetical protein